MPAKYCFPNVALVVSLLMLMLHPAFSAQKDSVVVFFNSENELWSAKFYDQTGKEYKTLEIDSTSIGAINTFLSEAGENAKIDILSPMSFVVSLVDPYQGISPLSGQTIDFHHNVLEISNPLKLRMNGIFAVRRNNVTIQNFRLAGSVTYGIWTQGCDNLTINNLDIDIDRNSGLAVFIRPRGSSRSRNLTIKGDVFINGGSGHAIEFTSVDTVNIGDVTVSNNINGCGINASGSTHIKIGYVYGYKNCYSLVGDGGGYATLRFSNAGQYLDCKGIYSRRSGRGYMIPQGDNSALPGVLGQHFSTVHMVDIKHTVRENIFIRGTLPTNNHVLSGTASASLFLPNNTIFIEGQTNSVTLGLPEISIDTTIKKTVRINELQFGFYDLSGNEHSENYIRDRSCDGFGYAKTADEIGAFMEWNVVSGSGNHDFKWRYACDKPKKAKLLLNGKYISTIEFAGAGSESIWQTYTLSVKGIKASKIKNIKLIAIEDKGLPLIDYMEVEAPGVTWSLKDISNATDSLNVIFDSASPVDITNNISNTVSNSFNIYSNPNNGMFTIVKDKGFESPFNVKIYNLYGSLVNHSETKSDNRVVVKINDNLKSIYLVKISSGNFRKTFKVSCL